MERVGDRPVVAVGRTRPSLASNATYLYCDLAGQVNNVVSELPQDPIIVVSFAPIWHLAHFIDRISKYQPPCLHEWKAIIACSSSSVVTKRFAVNQYDRRLVARLQSAEQLLASICQQHSIHCRIIAPTIIYGCCGGFSDRNLSSLRKLLLIFPLLPLPAQTGARQPIHCRQLADVVWTIAESFFNNVQATPRQEHLLVGGDDTISYHEMLCRLRDSNEVVGSSEKSHHSRCILLPIPNRIFHLLAAPILLISPKVFEAILRISADLSGFTPACKITSHKPAYFPIYPLH